MGKKKLKKLISRFDCFKLKQIPKTENDQAYALFELANVKGLTSN